MQKTRAELRRRVKQRRTQRRGEGQCVEDKASAKEGCPEEEGSAGWEDNAEEGGAEEEQRRRGAPRRRRREEGRGGEGRGCPHATRPLV